MFANFIYFIVALITLTLYQPTETPVLGPFQAFFSLIGLTGLFAVYTYNRFRRLARRVGLESQRLLDQRFGQLVTHQSIMALAVFALTVWVLDLPSHVAFLGVFEIFPSAMDLLFLVLFAGYLTIVWFFAFEAHRVIYRSDISRGTYVYSNVAFCLPILLPWALLFGIADILRLMPFELPRRILDTTVGQTGYFLIFLVMATIFAPLLIKRIWRCRPLEEGATRRRIEAICRRADVRYADIVYWPIFGGRMVTAGVMGIVGRFRYLLVTDALLQMLTPDEVDQVIAHEVGHVKRKHLLLYLLFLVGFMLISHAAYPLSFVTLFLVPPILSLVLTFNLNPANFIWAIYAFFLISGIVLYFRFVFGFFIRNFERQADLFVYRLFPDARALIATFEKIALTSGQPADKPNWHHFSIQERMDYLERCEEEPGLIDRHDRKVRNSILVYIVGFIVLSAGVFQLNQAVLGQGERQLRLTALENYLAQKMPRTDEDARLFSMLAYIHLERKNDFAAITAYEKALSLNPSDPDVLNNLAWLLATSEKPHLRDPQRALRLAREAIALEQAPHIWDTLAEALYVNGRIEEAIVAQRNALAMNPDNRQHYEDQLSKFEEALK
jgi:Zn-dependent protease with chaperone function